MSSDTQWINRYLDTEADRVVVEARLREVELGIASMSWVMHQPPARPRALSMVVAMAAAVAMVAIGAAALTRGATPTRVDVAAAPVDTAPAAPTDPTSPTTLPAAVEPPTTMVALTALADGGLRLGGQVPMCRELFDDEYDCTLTEPWPGDVPNYDDTGYIETLIDSSSIIAGGCRAVSADAQHWFCYLGQNAVDEGVLATYGEAKLGDWYPSGFVPG